jgi:hypothetical protein
LLARQVAAFEAMATVARAEGNVSGFASLGRALNSSVALMARLTPPPPRDPDDDPDVKAAAAEARELLRIAVERAVARRARR